MLERRPQFHAETLTLFSKLERMSRHSQAFKTGEHELARKVGLTDEYWTMNSVLDRSRGPCHPEGYIANRHWRTCRSIRRALLAASSGDQ